MLIFQVVEGLAGVAIVAMPVLVHATPSCSSAVTGRGETVETVKIVETAETSVTGGTLETLETLDTA